MSYTGLIGLLGAALCFLLIFGLVEKDWGLGVMSALICLGAGFVTGFIFDWVLKRSNSGGT